MEPFNEVVLEFANGHKVETLMRGKHYEIVWKWLGHWSDVSSDPEREHLQPCVAVTVWGHKSSLSDDMALSLLAAGPNVRYQLKPESLGLCQVD